MSVAHGEHITQPNPAETETVQPVPYRPSFVDGLMALIQRLAVQEAARLEAVLKGLTAEREILTKIPTWPWRPGLFTGFLSIVVLPIVLFLIQVALGRWLGR